MQDTVARATQRGGKCVEYVGRIDSRRSACRRATTIGVAAPKKITYLYVAHNSFSTGMVWGFQVAKV